MEDIKIVIPSHKRATRVLTTSAVDGAILCVADGQRKVYEACNPGIEVVCHPDSVLGLARKRDWIIKHFGSVFMLDDDIDALKRVYVEKASAHPSATLREHPEPYLVEPDVAYDIVQVAAQACRDAGFFLFGFSMAPNPLHYNSLAPVALSGYMTGCAHGVLAGSKLWYNPEIICNEDYWISCLNAYYHRGVWKDSRFYWNQKDTFVNRGGLAEYRNTDSEEKDFKLLQRVFGEEVIYLRKNKGKLKHEFQKGFRVPF